MSEHLEAVHSSLSQTLDRLLVVSLGFASGGALGLLLAPDKGRDTRQRLAAGAREVVLAAHNQVRDVAEPIAVRVRKASHELAERYVPLADDWDIVDGKQFLNDLPGLPRL